MTGVLQTNSLFSRFAVLGAHPDLHEIFCVFRSRDLQSHQSNPIQSNQIQPWAPWCPQAPPGSPPSLRVGPLGPPRDPGVGPRCEAPLRCGVARSAIYTDMCFCSPAPMRGLLLENHGHEHKIGYVRTYEPHVSLAARHTNLEMQSLSHLSVKVVVWLWLKIYGNKSATQQR
jgi:hypothetical protein